jgi:hypothetical protein
VNLRAGLDDVDKRKFLILSGLELRPLGLPVVQSLSRLYWFVTPERAQPVSAGFYLGLLFGPENGGDIFPKRRAIYGIHGVTTQQAGLLIVTAVRHSKQTQLNSLPATNKAIQ